MRSLSWRWRGPLMCAAICALVAFIVCSRINHMFILTGGVQLGATAECGSKTLWSSWH
jgi:hypothetical protein